MKRIEFAFIVHSRNKYDLSRKFPLLKILPDFCLDLITRHAPPFLVSKITGLKTKNNISIDGAIIGIPMTAHQLIEDRETALLRILQAVRLAKKRGAKYIGLGAMTSSLSKGGRDIIEHVPGVVITTGRTYTVKNIIDYIFYCLDTFGFKKEKITIGIVGAAGGIGFGVTMMLAKYNFKNFILIDLERKLESVRDKILLIENDSKDLNIKISHKVSEIYGCNIVIAATSAPEVVITSNDVSPGTIIINDAQPSDISPDILNNRNDVLVIEGGVLQTNDINCHLNMGLGGKNDIFSCLAETLMLAYSNSKTHYSIDHVDFIFLNTLKDLALELGFSIKKPQNDLGYITEEHIKNISKNLNKNISSLSVN